MEEKKKSKKWLWILLIVLVVLAGGGVGAYLFFVPKTVNLNDYITVTFSGYDGIGDATVTYDTEKLKSDLGKESDDNMEKVIQSSGAGLDRSTDLTNGDSLKLTYFYDNEIAYDSRITFTCTDETVTVAGLEEVEQWDPFEDIKLSFDGYGPFATVKMKNKSKNKVIKKLKISISPSSGISMGDPIKLKVKAYDKRAFIEKNHAVLTKTETEVTAPEMDQYLIRLDMLSPDQQKELDDITNRLGTKQYFKSVSRRPYVKVSKVEKIGEYLLVRKDRAITTGTFINKYYGVYKMTIKSRKKNKKGKPFFKTQTFYQPVEVLDIKLFRDGTMHNYRYSVSDVVQYTIRGVSKIKFDGFSRLYGYTSLDKMKKELVTALSDDYDCETKGDLP